MKTNHYFIKYLLSTLLLSSALVATGQEMIFYDPMAQSTEKQVAPTGPVSITIEADKPLLTIPKYFYGINIHPGTAKYEFARPDLLKALKPDSVRVMTRLRSDWLPNGQGHRVSHLSPERGTMDWHELDLLVNNILSIGATPYLALGFGPPSWMSDASTSLDRLPPKSEYVDEYADYMATIVKHYAIDKQIPIDSVTVENEPENVRYAIEDYARLFQLAKAKIKHIAPTVRVGGPVIGYAKWVQPDGSELNFYTSLNKLKSLGVNFDFIDWHIYSTSTQTVLETVKTVRRIYGKNVPLIISELNRDWRYSGPNVAQSNANNTGAESVAWLASIYDELQIAGVERTYYFAWRENNLGLVDGRITTLRPNYSLFSALTNYIGRKRVITTISNPAIGCIATSDNGELKAIIYNKTGEDIKTSITIQPSSKTLIRQPKTGTYTVPKWGFITI